MKKIIVIVVFILPFFSCKKNSERQPEEFHFEFSQSQEGWQSFFSDYPLGEEISYELEFAHSYLPAPLNGAVRALKISGNNHSDDLLSFIIRKFENLKPSTVYSVTFKLELASNATINGVGAGGSPDLELGVGGLSFKPNSTINQGYYRPNFISRLQSHESNNVLKSTGKIGVSPNSPTPFMLIERDNFSNPVSIKTNSNGELWLMIGTDSGYEGITTLYYKSISVTLK